MAATYDRRLTRPGKFSIIMPLLVTPATCLRSTFPPPCSWNHNVGFTAMCANTPPRENSLQLSCVCVCVWIGSTPSPESVELMPIRSSDELTEGQGWFFFFHRFSLSRETSSARLQHRYRRARSCGPESTSEGLCTLTCKAVSEYTRVDRPCSPSSSS